MVMLDEVVVIGAHLRVPGANNINEFIDNLTKCKVSVDNLLHRRSGAVDNTINVKGVINDYDCFDADFFKISDKEVKVMDPQHRMLLESVVHAMETTNIAQETKEVIGMFASCSANQKHLVSLQEEMYSDAINNYNCLIGNDKDYLATRVAYKLNFTGPACTIQSGCSSSLMALHQACRALQTYDCDIAVVGGISITLPMYQGYEFIDGMIYSKTGFCRPYSAQADGIVDGCGVGVVIVQRKQDAILAKRNIWGVINAGAVNNDGNSKASFLSPSVEQQIAVMQHALNQANLDAKKIGYIEGHGTGTIIGDAIELTALDEVYGKKNDNGLCYVGSVKANIGHLDAASGIVGFIKTVISVKQGKIFPQPNLVPVTTHIDQNSSNLRFPIKIKNWLDKNRYAAITSLGVGGTNIHMIVSNYPGDGFDIPMPITTFTKTRYPYKIDNEIDNLNDNPTSTLSMKDNICSNSNIEEKIILAWNQALGTNVTSINEDNFFEQGGNSLLALKLVDIVNKEIKINISSVILFNYPRLNDLKDFIIKQCPLKQDKQEGIYVEL